ncbi:M3 family oligoendopeptidase [Halonatronum saccharophilum]|uniref:M3 family oligoendopeptidase n=1 Tax=Halonatronum saccharophilum TaxID=150060 RepID=UPI0004896DC6|nr:M3 family oligoendopeptidase [Halonatronum saccharophilum]
MFKKKRYGLISLITLIILTILFLNINKNNYSTMDREEIPQRYKWDLSSIYSSDDEWAKDFDHFQAKLEGFERDGISVEVSGQELLNLINFKEEVARGVERVYIYALLRSDEDIRDNNNQKLLLKAEGLKGDLDKVFALISVQIANIPEERLQELLEEEEKLMVYKDYLLSIIRGGGYLSPKEERIISLAGGMAGSPRNIFRMINYADKGGGLNQNTRAAILNAKVEKDIFYMRARGYESVRESRGVPVEVYDSLIELVSSNLESLHRYRSTQPLKISTSAPYKGISYLEAQEIIVEALEPLGKDYIKVINKAFEERWIDLYPNKGKRKGAYQIGIYDHNPYIATNYTEDLRGLFTLVHELGHGVHFYYSSQNQPYLYSRSSILLAEVASTVNEILLINHLLNNADSRGEYSYLLNFYLQEFESTLYFQTMLAHFEREIYKVAQRGEALTAQFLSQLYYNLSQEYFGTGEGSYWSQIPHFYESTFYVYQYAISFPTALSIAYNILEEQEGSLESYLAFLKGGGSEESPYLLVNAGGNIMDEKNIERSLAHFNNILREYERVQRERKAVLVTFFLTSFIIMIALVVGYKIWKSYISKA